MPPSYIGKILKHPNVDKSFDKLGKKIRTLCMFKKHFIFVLLSNFFFIKSCQIFAISVIKNTFCVIEKEMSLLNSFTKPVKV